jgi:hypothetical protein
VPETRKSESNDASAWLARADKIKERVLVKKDMPPSGNLADTQRQAIQAWLECNRDAMRCAP